LPITPYPNFYVFASRSPKSAAKVDVFFLPSKLFGIFFHETRIFS